MVTGYSEVCGRVAACSPANTGMKPTSPGRSAGKLLADCERQASSPPAVCQQGVRRVSCSSTTENTGNTYTALQYCHH